MVVAQAATCDTESDPIQGWQLAARELLGRYTAGFQPSGVTWLLLVLRDVTSVVRIFVE